MSGAAIPRPRKRSRRCKQEASLPLDLLPEVAARSDPVTLVRCAATCKEMRRHIADPAFRRRLRLRHADRFVPTLLRGRLVEMYHHSLRLVDNATAKVTRLLSAGACFPGADGEDLGYCGPLAARDGLILVRVRGAIHYAAHDDKLCVFCPATGQIQALPPGPWLHGHYVLLVGGGDDGEGGGGAVGRPFQVLKACFVKPPGCWRSLQIHTFSSEQGAWSLTTRSFNRLIVHGDGTLQRPGNTVVVGDAVHWLYQLDRTYYVLKFHVRAARVTLTELPKSFRRAAHRSVYGRAASRILLATSALRRGLMVLVANNDTVSAWAQSERTGKWSKRPQFVKDCGVMKGRQGSVRLEWFAERSGVVLVTVPEDSSSFLLDLQSKDIIECSSAAVDSEGTCPYEDVSSWVPTFTKTF